MMLFQLFLSFLKVGLFSVGGGYAAIPLIQNEVTQNSWLTLGEFTDLVTIAEMTPGPIAVNSATFVGIRLAGLPGALAATFGCIFPSLILVSVMAFVYSRYRKLSVLQSILASLRPAVVALIAGAGLSILIPVLFGGAEISMSELDIGGLLLFLAAFVLLRMRKLSPIAVMCLTGISGLVVGLL